MAPDDTKSPTAAAAILTSALNEFPIGIPDRANILVHASSSSPDASSVLNTWTASRKLDPPLFTTADFRDSATHNAWDRGVYPFAVCHFCLGEFAEPLNVLKDVHHTLKGRGILVLTCWKGQGDEGGEEGLRELLDQAGWERGGVKVFARGEAWVVLARKWDDLCG